MKKRNQFIPTKRCRRCNSGMLVDAKTRLCWFCKKREQVSFEVEYMRVAQQEAR